jgi:hypothetical protein
MTPSGSVPSPSLDSVSSLGLAAFPRARRQDASKSVSTTDVTRHEHPPKHHLRRPSAKRPWENPPVLDFPDRPRFLRFRRFRGPRWTTSRSSSLQRPRA